MNEMHSELGLLYLNERRDLHFCFFLHKNYYVDSPTGLSEYIVCSDTVAIRSTEARHQNILLVPRVRTNMGEKSFQYRGPVCWNRLPADIKAIELFKGFKVAISKLVHTLFGDHPT